MIGNPMENPAAIVVCNKDWNIQVLHRQQIWNKTVHNNKKA